MIKDQICFYPICNGTALAVKKCTFAYFVYYLTFEAGKCGELWG